VDGKLAVTADAKAAVKPSGVPVSLTAGDHELAVFVAHAGRDKFVGYTGSLNVVDAQKGLRGPVVSGDGGVTITNWKMRGGVDPADPGLKWSASTASGGKPAFYRTNFWLDHEPEPGAVYRFLTKGLSAGSVWLNGHNLGRFPEILKDCPGIWLPACWMKAGKNNLVIFDEQGRSPRKSAVKLEETASRHRISAGLEPGTISLVASPWVPALPKPQVERRTEQPGRYRKEADNAKAGPFLPGDYGTSTHRGKFIYIHLKKWRENMLVLPGIPVKVAYVSVLTGGKAGFVQSDNKIVIFLALDRSNDAETILAIRLDRPAEGIHPVAATGREVPVPKPQGTVYQAEDAALSDGTGIASDHDGFLGKGFVAGYYQGFGQTTAFTVKAVEEGPFPAILRYSNGMGTEQTLSLYVNGQFIQRVKFKASSDWDTWDNVNLSLPLKKGNNTVSLQKRQGDGCVNLDYLAIQ
jgi:hypothetical protein